MHDAQRDAAENVYFPTEIFMGFNVRKLYFMWKSVLQGRKSQLLILSHINLLPVGWLVKKVNPKVKLVLFAHGIEVWDKVGNWKRRMLYRCDEIVSVSEYTRQKMMLVHGVESKRCTVLNNCLDPFLPLPKNVQGMDRLRKRYGITADDKIIFTLTRLSAKERYKGYDKVMRAILALNDKKIKYIIAGTADAEEKSFIDKLSAELGLNDQVILAGFIPEEEVAEHFRIADLYVMPSVKEGFGIVFIEAMYYGLPVIAGNKDGSVDALLNGKLGMLTDPSDVDNIRVLISKVLLDRTQYIPDAKLLADYFSFETYKTNLNKLFARHLPVKNHAGSLVLTTS